MARKAKSGRCDKCGGELLDWGGEPLCKNWHCWPVAPSDPTACERSGGPLASELTAFGNDLMQLVARHDRFLARAAFVNDPKTGAFAPVTLMAVVMADVFWRVYSSQAARGIDVGQLGFQYANTWMYAVQNAIRQSVERPAGTTVN